MRPFATTATKFAHSGLPRSAYVHLPFCRSRCNYCDFSVVTVGTNRRLESDAFAAEYASVVQRETTREWERTKRLLEDRDTSTTNLKTVYFGGGTPSLLAAKEIATLLEHIDATFGLAADCEITLECDPGTFDRGKLRSYVKNIDNDIF